MQGTHETTQEIGDVGHPVVVAGIKFKHRLLCRPWCGFRLEVLVEPIEISLVAVADKAGLREAVELARVDDQLRWHIEAA